MSNEHTRRVSPRERREKAISDHVMSQLSDRVRMLIMCAMADLDFGPSAVTSSEEHDYPGFERATREISRGWPVSDLWLDDDSECVLESKPEEHDECWIRYSARDVKRVFMGSLAEHV